MSLEILLIIPFAFIIFFVIMSLYNKKCQKPCKKTPKKCRLSYQENFEPFEQHFKENYTIGQDVSCRVAPFICPTGGFCASTGLSGPTICPIGSYCPSIGLSGPTQCDVGYYCNANGLASQTECPTGSYCSTTIGSPVVCVAGEYCPVKSTINNKCATGSFCSTPSSQVVCSSGNYCPVGSTAQVQCALGSYCSTPSTQLACSNGNYCATGSIAQVACPAGSFCPNPSTKNNCVAGTYCPASSTAATPCPAGSYCAAQVGTFTQCPAGSFCPASTGVATSCTIGNYCPAGASAQATCAAGSVCTTPSSQVSCPAGYYCISGTSVPTICASGYYCSVGSSSQTQCPAGSYCPSWTPKFILANGANIQTSTNTPGTFTSVGVVDGGGKATITSEEGYTSSYVSFKTSTPNSALIVGLSSINTSGRYDTINFAFIIDSSNPLIIYDNNNGNSKTMTDTTKPISETDTYLITHDGTSVKYYQNNNLLRTINYSGTLYLGSYFNRNATITNLDFGPYSDLITGKALCASGSYCPAGSFAQTQCALGSYCSTPSTQLACSQGDYCATGSISRALCPTGFWCPNPSTKNTCTSGQYCPAGSIAATTCPSGYYCPNTSTQTICPAGSYCPPGSISATVCPTGSYCASTGMSNPDDCPTGYYCPTATTQIICPTGYFCPNVSNCANIITNPSSVKEVTIGVIGNENIKTSFNDPGVLTSMTIQIPSIQRISTGQQTAFALRNTGMELYIDDVATGKIFQINLNDNNYTFNSTNFSHTPKAGFTSSIDTTLNLLNPIGSGSKFYFKDTNTASKFQISGAIKITTTVNKNTISPIPVVPLPPIPSSLNGKYFYVRSGGNGIAFSSGPNKIFGYTPGNFPDQVLKVTFIDFDSNGTPRYMLKAFEGILTTNATSVGSSDCRIIAPSQNVLNSQLFYLIFSTQSIDLANSIPLTIKDYYENNITTTAFSVGSGTPLSLNFILTNTATF